MATKTQPNMGEMLSPKKCWPCPPKQPMVLKPCAMPPKPYTIKPWVV